MLYVEYVNKAMEETIEQADNGLYYLNPLWQTILEDMKLICSDKNPSAMNLESVLKLEVERRNTINSKKPYIESMISDLFSETVEPIITEQETEFFKELVEYMKAKKGSDTNRDSNVIPFPVK